MTDLERLKEIIDRTPSEKVDAAAHWHGRWEFAMEMMDSNGMALYREMKEKNAVRKDAERLAAALRRIVRQREPDGFRAAAHEEEVAALAEHDALMEKLND